MRIRIFILAISLIVMSCAVRPPLVEQTTNTIRIGITTGTQTSVFQAGDNFKVYSYDGTLIMNGDTGDRCTVSIVSSSPASLVYRLVSKKTPYKKEASQYVNDLNRKGLSAIITTIQTKMMIDGEFGNFDMNYVCIDKDFTRKQDAQEFRRSISSIVYTTVTPFMKNYPKGVVRLTNERTGEKVESNFYLRIAGDVISIESKTGQGFHFENKEKRIYNGYINYVIDKDGKLTVVNEIPIRDYLSGVVSSEMNPNFPLEALKAQAVTARSFMLTKMGRQHSLEPFDLCDDVHCQVYTGVGRVTTNALAAVRETEGEVLTYNDEICEAYYSGVCGGHTEHNENVWEGSSKRYLRGVFDLPSANVEVEETYLQNENNIKKWVKTEPRVFCNVNLIDCPSYLEYTKKYFRWTVEYTQSELRAIIENKIGRSIGSIKNIIPLERGISGRLMKIKIDGTKDDITIKKELEIRRVLSNSYLYSACFIVEKGRVSNNIPQTFTIHGAGWGHGVGMCQTGAAIMALRGTNYKSILNHYYRESHIKRVY